MNESKSRTIKVLIFSRDPAWDAGVVNFTTLLMQKSSSRVEFDHFKIGRRREHRRVLQRLVQPLFDAVELAKRLRTRQYDVIHLNPSINRASVLRETLFLLILKMYGMKKLVIFIRGWDDKYFEKLTRGFTGRRIVLRLFSQASRVLVLGEKFKRALLEAGFNKDVITVISTMFDGDTIKRATRSRDDKTVQLLFLGRIVISKGVFELLDAVHQCVIGGMNIRLVMAGYGEEREAAEQWVVDRDLSDSVSFPGYLRGEAKAQVLVDSDLFVIPSYSEGCPNALLEAMGAGLPIIGSSVGGIPDVVEHGINGILLDQVTAKDIRLALEMLVPDRRLRLGMGKINRGRAWSNYEASVVSSRIEEVYNEIALS